FRDEGLLKCFKQSLREMEGAEEIKATLVSSLRAFQKETPPFDDQTLLILAEQSSARRKHVPEDFSR
ncbi:MAG: hypothetical protein ACK4UN_04475, partial [Limisphaerales bacterium]